MLEESIDHSTPCVLDQGLARRLGHWGLRGHWGLEWPFEHGIIMGLSWDHHGIIMGHHMWDYDEIMMGAWWDYVIWVICDCGWKWSNSSSPSPGSQTPWCERTKTLPWTSLNYLNCSYQMLNSNSTALIIFFSLSWCHLHLLRSCSLPQIRGPDPGRSGEPPPLRFPHEIPGIAGALYCSEE